MCPKPVHVKLPRAPHTHVASRHQHWHCKASIVTQTLLPRDDQPTPAVHVKYIYFALSILKFIPFSGFVSCTLVAVCDVLRSRSMAHFVLLRSSSLSRPGVPPPKSCRQNSRMHILLFCYNTGGNQLPHMLPAHQPHHCTQANTASSCTFPPKNHVYWPQKHSWPPEHAQNYSSGVPQI